MLAELRKWMELHQYCDWWHTVIGGTGYKMACSCGAYDVIPFDPAESPVGAQSGSPN